MPHNPGRIDFHFRHFLLTDVEVEIDDL